MKKNDMNHTNGVVDMHWTTRIAKQRNAKVKGITRRDIQTWLVAVPRIDPQSSWGNAYIVDYNVHEKILRAKEDGYWDDICELARRNRRPGRLCL